MIAPLQSTWRIGEWLVSPDLGEISRNGDTKRLDPRAMRLLMFLAERPGEVVGLNELLNGVWDKSVVTPHSVYEAVAALRQALGDSTEKPEYLVTLPRRGYRLIAPVVATGPAEPEAVGLPVLIAAASSSGNAPQPVRPRRAAFIWLGVFFSLGVIVTVAWLVRGSLSRSVPAPVEKSIAVLPFIDLTDTRSQQYLADGIAVELLDVLANLSGMRVIERTSSFQFRGTNENVRSIGAQLGVEYVVEGTVRRSVNHVRVTAQLIRASDGVHLWSGAFDRDASDTMKLESELAIAIGRALEISVASTSAPMRNRTTNVEAYDHYLRGLHALDSYTPTGAQEAASLFQAAIALDSRFVSAHESLAMTHYVQAAFSFVPPDVGFPRAREVALDTLRLNAQSSVAHALLARVATLYTWDWDQAALESATALRLAPQSSFALYAAGDLASIIGKYERAEELLRASLASDPLNPETHLMLALTLRALGRLDAAEAEARRCLAIAPDYAFAHHILAVILMLQDRAGDDYVAECRRETPEGGQLNCLAVAYGKLGRAREADAALDQSIKTRAASSAYGIARVFAYHRQADQAFDWLGRAYRQRDPILPYIMGDPAFVDLKQDRRFRDLLRLMHLPE